MIFYLLNLYFFPSISKTTLIYTKRFSHFRGYDSTHLYYFFLLEKIPYKEETSQSLFYQMKQPLAKEFSLNNVIIKQ